VGTVVVWSCMAVASAGSLALTGTTRPSGGRFQ
jgi:hypothetical protein